MVRLSMNKPRARQPAISTPATAATDALLIRAAMAEFNERGFGATDTNKIARRAGFAPQTFYRWFADKTAIFLAAYRSWEDVELAAIRTPQGTPMAAKKMAATIIAHHRAHLGFRRSLRQLAYEDTAVRRARAASRKRQIAQIRAWMRARAVGDDEIALILLQMERLSDAIAEGEVADLGVNARTAEAALVRLIESLRRTPLRR
jgi:AcrR family transcriptional regulator